MIGNQTKSSEELRCPTRSAKRPPLDVYATFLSNVQEFQKLDSLPVKLNFDDQATAQIFLENNASWHKQCHQKFNSSMLESAKLKSKRKRKADGGELNSRPKRRGSTAIYCIFCESSTLEPLHEFKTFNIDKSIKDMAREMCDSEMLVKLSGGMDLVAIEAKYHLSCLTNYRNRYRAFYRAQAGSSMSSNSLEKQAKARAFAELVMLVENGIEQDTCVFKLADLHAAYEKRIEQLINVRTSINRTRLKGELLDYFQKYGIQEQSDGKNVILIFPKGMQELLQSSCILSECKSEAVQFANVAKIIRKEMFQNETNFKFEGGFPISCQKDSVPYSLKLLISMILNGPSLKSEESNINSQNCLTVSQIILHNAKKKHTTFERKGTRHSLDREPPLPVYIGLKIHSLARTKKLIETCHSLGISISYDRVIELEKDMALSMSANTRLTISSVHLIQGEGFIQWGLWIT